MKPNSDTISFHGISIPVEDLYCHTLVIGRPGAGKSRCCIRPLLNGLVALNAQGAERKPGMLLIDGKGSELRGYLEDALRKAGREDDLVVVGPNAADATFNPLDPSWSDVKTANELIAAVNFLGGDVAQLKKASEPFWTGRCTTC